MRRYAVHRIVAGLNSKCVLIDRPPEGAGEPSGRVCPGRRRGIREWGSEIDYERAQRSPPTRPCRLPSRTRASLRNPSRSATLIKPYLEALGGALVELW